MATVGTMNAAIAPSFDSIQQLLLYTVAKLLISMQWNSLTNDLSHNAHVLFQLKLQLLV